METKLVKITQKKEKERNRKKLRQKGLKVAFL